MAYSCGFFAIWLIRKNGSSIPIVSTSSDDLEKCNEIVSEKPQNDSEEKDIDQICINVNTATLEELILIPGIGKTIAQEIINKRMEKGQFQKIEDLEQVKGLGPSKLSRIKDFISF